eukprot:Tamp_20513.p1 GENE.Tamp_20513~~Tamp_20513.p1  ORF type:complete len:327 (+),score=62.89 Tamp_20513:146-982(+)
MGWLGEIMIRPADFSWQPGVTPMSDFLHVIYAEIGYFSMIFGLRWWMGPAETKQKDGAGLKLAMCVHNAFLCLLSAAMFAGAGYEAYLRSKDDGVRWLFCEEIGRKASGGVYYWSYIYYLSKYIEFIDTLFKVLKRKPLDFLHTYHHAVVALMCWNWMTFSQSLQTMGLMFNALVHVFMYFYFALTVYMPPPWWKKFITTGQIIQFQSSFVLALPFFYIHIKEVYVEGSPGCEGAGSVYLNAAFNLSLLALFISFKKRTYANAPIDTVTANAKKAKAS